MDVKLRIHRFVEGRKWEQGYTVTLRTGMTVLEALIEIKEKQAVLLLLMHLPERIRR